MNFDRSTLIIVGTIIGALLVHTLMPTTFNKALAVLRVPQ